MNFLNDLGAGEGSSPAPFQKQKSGHPARTPLLTIHVSWYVFNKLSNSAFSRSGAVLTSALDTVKVINKLDTKKIKNDK